MFFLPAFSHKAAPIPSSFSCKKARKKRHIVWRASLKSELPTPSKFLSLALKLHLINSFAMGNFSHIMLLCYASQIMIFLYIFSAIREKSGAWKIIRPPNCIHFSFMHSLCHDQPFMCEEEWSWGWETPCMQHLRMIESLWCLFFACIYLSFT